ncbi:MAG: SH3 domain-containing protein [Christensenellales bacterium]|nr:SH3 domain-containing protein [Christensenellales bacterium]
MKPIQHAACLFALCALFAVQPAATLAEDTPAEIEQAESQTLQTSKQANLRKLPNKKSDKLETLKKASVLTVISVSEINGENWAYVRTKGGREGYILYELLEPVPTPTPEPTATPTPTPSPEPTATPDADSKTPAPTAAKNAVQDETVYDEPRLVRTLKRANLRKKPDGSRLGEIAADTALTAVGEVEKDGELWLHIEKGKNNKEGYMLAELVRQVKPVELIPVTEGEVRALFPVVGRDPIAEIKNEIPFTYTEEELAQYHTLNVGDRNADVLALRKRLYELGYYAKPNENALYTESTADVVRMFQQDCGLEETGTADPYTQALLFDDRMLAREGSAQEVTYLQNKAQPLYIQRAEITSYSFYGSVQVSVRNNTSGKLTAFGLKIIPNMSDGELVDMADTFAEQIEKEYNLDSIAVARGNSYSDFETNGKAPLYNDPDDYEEPEIGEVYIYPHHFQVSYKQYFTGAQVAVSWYRAAGRNVYIDDDQMVFVSVGKGTDELMTYTLPIAISDSQREEARKWEMGIVARYVLPVYQDYYNLPQGAYLRSVEEGSPAQEAGLQEGDIIVGIGEQTILGDMTLRLSRASFAPGDIQTVYFWRDGQYYTTEMMRPENG